MACRSGASKWSGSWGRTRMDACTSQRCDASSPSLAPGWLQGCAPSCITLEAKWKEGYLPHAGKLHGVTLQASPWGCPAGGMLGCPCSLLGRDAPGRGHTHVPLRAFFGQGFLKLKCINRRHGNPGMKLRRPLAALDVWSRSKDAAVKPGLEQDDTVQ